MHGEEKKEEEREEVYKDTQSSAYCILLVEIDKICKIIEVDEGRTVVKFTIFD